MLFTYPNASVSNKRENVCEKNKEKENKGEILSKLKKSGNERLFERERKLVTGMSMSGSSLVQGDEDLYWPSWLGVVFKHTQNKFYSPCIHDNIP